MRADRPAALPNSRRGPPGDLRIPRGLIQPSGPPFRDRLPIPQGLRTSLEYGGISKTPTCPWKRGNPSDPGINVQETYSYRTIASAQKGGKEVHPFGVSGEVE
jgi:hypothetical protein